MMALILPSALLIEASHVALVTLIPLQSPSKKLNRDLLYQVVSSATKVPRLHIQSWHAQVLKTDNLLITDL